MAKKPSKPAAKRGGAKIAAPKKAKARTKKPSKTARKKSARPVLLLDGKPVTADTVLRVSNEVEAQRELGQEAFAQAHAGHMAEAAARGVERAQAQKPRWWTRFKSAVNGLFVSPKQAEADPDGTYGTRLRRKG